MASRKISLLIPLALLALGSPAWAQSAPSAIGDSPAVQAAHRYWATHPRPQNPPGDGSICDWEYSVGIIDGPEQKAENTLEHASGYHFADFLPHAGCDYSGDVGLCSVAATATPYAIMGELGTLNYSWEDHIPASGGQYGAASGPSPQTATAITGGGVESCKFSWCSPASVAVGFPPVVLNFTPTSSLWSSSQVWAHTCAKETAILQCGGKKVKTVNGKPPKPICKCIKNGCCSDDCGPSPILIDTTGKGFHVSGAESCVRFDIKGDGHPVCVAWPEAGSGNGWLALDRNHNGKIDDGKELFGEYTEQEFSRAPNGYVALQEFDEYQNGGEIDGKGNPDYVIDQRDAIYKDLVVWIDDSPRDGISQPWELHSLKELGILSLSTAADRSQKTDSHGNTFQWTAPINQEGNNPGDAIERQTYDVFLVVKQ
jgi:hypothetical protein